MTLKKVYNNSRLLAVYESDVFKWKKNENGEWVCMNCGKSLSFNKRLRTYCSSVCANEFSQKNYLTWERVREQIWKRDNYKCVKCGRGVALYPLTDAICGAECDHIVPLFKGGKDWYEDLPDLKNFQTLCEKCHKQKSSEEHWLRGRSKIGKEIVAGKQKILWLT